MSRLTNKYFLICINIIWIAIIFILCSMPDENIPNPQFEIPHLDKIAHFGMFYILSILLLVTFKIHSSLNVRHSYLIVILISLSCGGTIEVLQHEFFSRGCELGDLVADIMGGVFACLSFPLVARFLKK